MQEINLYQITIRDYNHNGYPEKLYFISEKQAWDYYKYYTKTDTNNIDEIIQIPTLISCEYEDAKEKIFESQIFVHIEEHIKANPILII